MTRGIRGATTVLHNDKNEIVANTKQLIEAMVDKNNIQPEDISHMFVSVTKDLNATFPSKALRKIPGWVYVPVMCMQEIEVPNSLSNCIRIMMIVNTDVEQQRIQHIYHNEAVQLRPDLVKENSK